MKNPKAASSFTWDCVAGSSTGANERALGTLRPVTGKAKIRSQLALSFSA
jgi:hypothetical protein